MEGTRVKSTDMNRLQTAARAAETVTGRFMMSLLALIFGALLTALSSLILINMVAFRDTANLALKTAQGASSRNDIQDLRLNTDEAAHVETKTAVEALKGEVDVNDLRIQKNTDSIQQLNSVQKQLLHRGR